MAHSVATSVERGRPCGLPRRTVAGATALRLSAAALGAVAHTVVSATHWTPAFPVQSFHLGLRVALPGALVVRGYFFAVGG